MPPPKVVAKKGTKKLGQAASAERGELVTMIGIIRASGEAIPPVFVLPRVFMKDEFLLGAPEGSLGFANKSGWSSTEIFFETIKHIQN